MGHAGEGIFGHDGVDAAQRTARWLLRDGVYQLEDDRTMVSYGLNYDTEIICELPDAKDRALKGQSGAGTPLRDSTPPPRGRASLSSFEV